MCRNERLADVTVDPRTYEVRVDGEPVAAEPLAAVALSGRYLLG
jgi:urease alpha subunit